MQAERMEGRGEELRKVYCQKNGRYFLFLLLVLRFFLFKYLFYAFLYNKGCGSLSCLLSKGL